MSRFHRLMPLLINSLMFQAIWLLCIFGGDSWAMAGVLILAAWLWFRRLPGELHQIAAFSVCGIVLDSVWMLAGLMVFQDTLWPDAPLIPLWLMILWISFAATLRHSMFFIIGRPGLAALFGVLAVPLSYTAGAHLANVSINNVTLVAVGASWAGLLAIAAARIKPETPCDVPS